MSFSKRMGINSAVELMQLESIDSDLRNGLWNALKIFVFDFFEKNNQYGQQTNFNRLCQIMWMHFYKLPIDTLPNNPYQAESFIRENYFECKWFEVYDLLEFIANINQEILYFEVYSFKEHCNEILERENAGYRFVDDRICPITNSLETSEIEEAIGIAGGFTALKGANTHLKSALEMLSDKKSPDYRNSVKESISAVESVAKKISANKNDTLGGALDKIKGKIKIHPSLERGFKQIYGYTSDADGIRHAITEDANCDFEDAKLMLVLCSAFINYLISKASKLGVDFNH